MKSILIFVLIVLVSITLYPQQGDHHAESYKNRNATFRKEAGRKSLSESNHDVNRQSAADLKSKANKYRMLGDMAETVSGGAFQYADSTKYEYVFNNYRTEDIYFRWDIIHWASLSKIKRTYDQNYNVLIEEAMNFDGMDWIGEYQYIYTYDQENRLLSTVYQEYNYSLINWDNVSRNVNRYDNRGYEIEELGQNWSSGNWVNSYRVLFNNDDSGNVIQSISQIYNSGSWKNNFKTERTYNIQNGMLTNFGFNWNSTTSSWDNYSKILFTRDLNNNIMTSTAFDWNSGAWVENEQYSYTYNSGNLLLSKIYQSWNSSLSQWVMHDKQEYTYNSNGMMLSEYCSIWNIGTSSWVYDFRYLYTYGSNNNRLSETHTEWISGAWVDNYRHLYTYDNNNNELSDTYADWDVPSSAWVDASRYHFYWEMYEENAGLTEDNNRFNIRIFPNPASTYIEIVSPLEIIGITLYNSAGQIVYQKKTKSNAEKIELNTLVNGLYIIQAETKEGIIYKKMQINNYQP